MAKTIEQLQEELGKVSKDTRRAYDLLYSKQRSGRYYLGLYRQLDIAKNTLKKKGLFESAKKEAESIIASLEPKIKEAEAEYKKFQEQKNALNKELKAIKTEEQEKKTKTATTKGIVNIYTDVLDELKKAELGIEGYQGETKYQDAYRKAEQVYNDAIKKGISLPPLGSPKIVVPPLAVKEDTGVKGEKTVTPENISAFIGTLADPKNSAILKQVQQDLVDNFGYKGLVDGKYSLPLQNAINSIATSRSSLPANLQGNDFRTFIADKTSSSLLGLTATGAATGSGGTSIANYIADATQAAAIVNSVVQKVLRREASAKEVKDLSAILVDAQKKNPFRTTNGIRTGGINEEQLLTDVIKSGTYAANKKLGALPILKKLAAEVNTRKGEARNLDAEVIRQTARSNMLELTDAQVNNFLNDLKAGQDINTINSRIRNIAAMGMPDNIKKMVADGVDLETIYQPYKNRMASILELNPESINMNDATLRSAIGPDKEMSLYDFQKALRRDSRWQYTNQAKEEVSSTALRVLRDFGFQG
jgi:predicted transcriptional regulator